MSDEDCTAEFVDDAAYTILLSADSVRKDSYLMIRDRPCKVAEVTTSKSGKHGRAKCHFVAFDVFSGRKYEDIQPSSITVKMPIVLKTNYLLVNIDKGSGRASLLLESGENKDVHLPNLISIKGSTDADVELARNMTEAFDAGKTVIAAVLSACGQEKLVGFNTTD